MGQFTEDGTLVLTPDECFFPGLGLKLEGTGRQDGERQLNGGNSFGEIRGWDEGEVVEWGVWLPASGSLDIATDSDGGRFRIELVGETGPVRQRGGSFEVEDPGFYRVLARCEDGGASVRLRTITLTGEAVEGGAVVRKRWRPAAAHAKFSSSRDPGDVRLWIMELDAVPGTLGFYCPVTTPFGYYGPTWNADGTVNTSFNFSLWSFGRNEPEPPVEELSHLLAIGHPDATFGGFDHEGTGVKIRDWEPLEGRQGQRQAIALRVEPGDPYDTYYSYFFAHDEKRWRLFGSGRKHNEGKPLRNLWVGSFVEVPGPPPVQRTGPYERRMRYRGWVMDENEKWYALDRMANGNIDRETGLTHTDRGVTDDGWFFLQTGGWTFRDPPNGGEPVEAGRARGKPDVDYLDADELAYLKTVPTSIRMESLERRGARARVRFHVRHAGDRSEAWVYWGAEEGLTFADRWENREPVRSPREGTNEFVIEGIDEDAPLKVRVFLRNEEGQFWSDDTASAMP